MTTKNGVIDQLKWSEETISPNIKITPVNNLPMNDDGMDRFNKIIEWCELNIGTQNRITWTPSGGMKKNGYWSRYGIRSTHTTIELIIYYKARMTRVCFRNHKEDAAEGSQIYGAQAFAKFKAIMTSFGVDIDEWKLDSDEEGARVKETIPRVKISMNPFILNKELDEGNVHHMDLNSSYLSGMKEFEPKWGAALDWMYEHRKDNPIMKSIMVMTTGYMQSIKCNGARWAHFSKAGIEYNNRKIEYYAAQLQKNGRKILGFNTDGIWYQGEVFHDEFEGTGLGKWKNDYTDCRKFRAKSNGAYEFIDKDGAYHPVIRGFTNLDKLKDRTEWSWGDIYQATVIEYYWDNEEERIIK